MFLDTGDCDLDDPPVVRDEMNPVYILICLFHVLYILGPFAKL